MKTTKIRRKWLIWASSLTVVLVAFYFTLHFIVGGGAENIYLQKDQLSIINTFIVQSDTVILAIDSPKASVTDKASVSDKPKVSEKASVTVNAKALPKTSDSYKEVLIKDYIKKCINGVDDKDIDQLFKTYRLNQLITVLPYYPFKVNSFFWLIGNKVLLEVAFWSLFGLIASLMYSVTTLRNMNEFMIREHIGKVFYTPFICIVIYLALNALMNSGSISLTGVGKSVIVLSFILGFFTRRAILLLEKIKDLILPKTPETIEADNELRNKYPNEIKGTVTVSSLNGDDLLKIKKNIQITAERNCTGEDKQSYYKITENLDEDGKFSFNTLKSGIYHIECHGEINSEKYESKMTIPMEDSDVPIRLKIDLVKVEKKSTVETQDTSKKRVVIPVNDTDEPVEILLEFKKEADGNLDVPAGQNSKTGKAEDPV